MINHLNKSMSKHVITIEDPIEYVYPDDKCLIAQRDLGDDTRSFADALKSSLRQDPDVILVGEMRDLDTISAVITAAETGHLVLSTVHTNNAPETIDRLIDVFPPYQQQQIRFQLSQILLAVLSQRLLQRSEGKGRIAAFEIMICTDAIRNLIREGKTDQIPTYLQTGSKQGMKTLDQALLELIEQGLVNMEKCTEISNYPDKVETATRISVTERYARN
jgi:twitching motility protein PilT